MSELNKKLLEAIDYRKLRNIDRNNFQSYNAQEIESIANECEKICLQQMILLCNDFLEGYITISNAIKKMEKQLNKLK